MSEKERKIRALYRKNREKWIFAHAMIACVVAVAILICSIVAYQLNKTYYIGYQESGAIDYNVFLKDNEFYEEDHLGKNQSYVASLIDKIIADYSYEIDMDTEDVNYKYSYTIKSKLEILDNNTQVAIFEPEKELVNVQNKSQSSSNRLRINEIVVINYDEYNDLANKFLDAYELTTTTSNIVVTLDVDVLSDCNAFSGSSVDNYTSELRIPLTTKTVNIKMTSSVPGAESKMIACTRGAGYEAFKTTAIVLGVIELIIVLLLVAFIYLTRTEDITYNARVKKILSQYKSYIQKINNMFDSFGYQKILVDTFEEMLEIRDTIQAPILMYENEEKSCTKFLIPTDSKLLYIYEIKIEGYSEPEDPPAPTTPTTIVSPNITNVVRPVVKVVLNNPKAPEKEPEKEIKTVLEEPVIEADDAVDVKATVEDGDDEYGFDDDQDFDEKDFDFEDTLEEAEPVEEPAVVEIPEAIEEPEVVEIPEAIEEPEVIEIPEVIEEPEVIEIPEVIEEPEVIEIPETVEASEEVDLPAELDGDSEAELVTIIDGRVVKFRYRRSFQSKLIQSDDRIKGYYKAIRNKLLSYKGVKARTSWRFESCNKGRIQCAKLNITGKTLLVYLNLKTENYSVNKYHFRDVGDKVKFKEVPMLLKVRSDRGLKYVLELIGEMMNVLGIPEGKIQNVDYDIPYRTTEELIKEGLIKVVFNDESEESAVESENSSELESAPEFENESAEAETEDDFVADNEVESLLASIPTVEEETVDSNFDAEAIDVFWKERPNKTYRYDPDGNEVDSGDVVLVPTRDAKSDKEIVREAEVSKGNYGIDSSTLGYPLKKIIGVVRRKAEKAFVALITPDENEIEKKK